MAWNKIVTADSVIQRLYEDKGFYQLTNRSYDSLVTPGASSVRRPKLATLVAKKNDGTSATDTDRKKTKAGTTMVETDLDVYTVPIMNEMAAKFESNDELRKQYEISMSMALKRKFNVDTLTAAQATSNVEEISGAELAWADLIRILRHYEENEVPEEDRNIVIGSGFMEQFYNIDVIKTAVGFNMDLLKAGMSNQMLGANWYVSGISPTIGGKATVTSWYGPGLAFILSKDGEIKETYDPGTTGVTTPGDVIDMLAHAGCELDDDDFAFVLKNK